MRYDELTAYYEEKYDDLVRRFSYRSGGIHNAEDVVQEAFARACQYITSFDPANREFGSWFNSILNNALRDFKREERSAGTAVQEDRVVDSLELKVHDETILEQLAQEISSMPSVKAREVLRQFVFLGYSAKECARTTDASLPYVRKVVQNFYNYAREVYG